MYTKIINQDPNKKQNLGKGGRIRGSRDHDRIKKGLPIRNLEVSGRRKKKKKEKERDPQSGLRGLGKAALTCNAVKKNGETTSENSFFSFKIKAKD